MTTRIRQSSRDGHPCYVLTVYGPELPHRQRVTVDRVEYAQALSRLYRTRAHPMAITALLQAVLGQN